MKHEFFPPVDQTDRLDTARETVVLLCEARQSTRPWKMTRLDDISQNGFRIAWYPDCLASAPLRIRIPGLQVLSAEIRWRDGATIGCRFMAPLHIAVFDHIVRQAKGG